MRATDVTADVRVCTTLFVASVLVLGAGSFWGLPSGKAVVGALVILDGGVPYRDFWTMYAPGQFYAVAALFWLFGRELLVQALAVAVVRAASAVTFFVLLRRLGATRGVGLSLSAVFVLMFWSTAPELTDYPPALLFILMALTSLACYFEGGRVRDLRWAGVWIGAAACFKHDVAAYITFGMAVSVFVSWVLSRGHPPASRRPPLGATLTIAAFALAVVAPLAAWTAWSAGSHAWNDLFVFPATVFRDVRGDPFPPLIPDLRPVSTWLSDFTNVSLAKSAAESLSTWIVLRVPPVIFLGGLLALFTARRRFDAAGVAYLVLGLAPMPFFWLAAHVQHNTHPYSMAILGACVSVVIWSRLAAAAGERIVRRSLAVGLAAYGVGLLTPAAIDGALVCYQWSGSRVLDLSGLRGVRVPARVYDAFQPVGEFFREHTAEAEPVYTGLARHDSIVINNTLLYAIVGRPSCCRYTELHPGVGDREPVQREIVRMLEERRVKAIALWEFGWSAQMMEARKSHTMAAVADAGATVLDRYIAEHFQPIARHGEYHVLWRRDAPVPE
jgi:hypothetical protein